MDGYFFMGIDPLTFWVHMVFRLEPVKLYHIKISMVQHNPMCRHKKGIIQILTGYIVICIKAIMDQ